MGRNVLSREISSGRARRVLASTSAYDCSVIRKLQKEERETVEHKLEFFVVCAEYDNGGVLAGPHKTALHAEIPVCVHAGDDSVVTDESASHPTP